MKQRKIWASLHAFYEGGAILGRKVANRRFMDALLRADPYDAYHFFLETPDDVELQNERLKKYFPEMHAAGRFAIHLRRELPVLLAANAYHCFHLSDCFVRYTALMQARNAYSVSLFPVTAPTHSLSYSDYGQGFLHHLWSGVCRRDAVVATSRAGKAVVDGTYSFLRKGYGLDPDKFAAPAVRIIPLGVEPSDMPTPEEKPQLSAAKRAELGIGAEEVVFLVFARISYLSKMDLLPMLRAFKRAERVGLTAGSYRLLVAGWQEEEDAFGEEIQRFAANLGIKCTLAVRPDNRERKALYACADIFLSPSDNLQETFGLTMLEAAAASLPVIASDFDGYKDLVLHGETGFLIPTLGPAATRDTNVRASFAPSGEYHLRLAQQCVVELEPMAEAMARLAADAGLRRAMGEKGRCRALAEYAWERIIERYVELWDELAALPLSTAEEKRLRTAVHPAGLDYMEIFGGYFSERLQAPGSENGHPASAVMTRLVCWSAAGEAVYRGRDFPVIYNMIADSVPPDTLKRLLFAARKPVPLADLSGQFAACPVEGRVCDKDFLLLWVLKHDLLEFV